MSRMAARIRRLESTTSRPASRLSDDELDARLLTVVEEGGPELREWISSDHPHWLPTYDEIANRIGNERR